MAGEGTTPPGLTRLLVQWSLCWLAGWLGFSYSWLLLALVLHTRTGGAGVRARLGEGEASLAALEPESLPSWVLFPSVDRVEWLNTMLAKMWPHLGRLVQDLAKERGQAEVNQLLNFLGLEKISQFRVRHLWLGGQPPRLGGIRVYEQNTAPDEIVMDVDLIYSGDASLAFSLQGIPCEVKQVRALPDPRHQVRLRSTVRLVLRPLLSVMPFLGGLEVYLLEMPDFSYSFAGLANVADMPGLNVKIKSELDKVGSKLSPRFG
jgi:hypothetical protein